MNDAACRLPPEGTGARRPTFHALPSGLPPKHATLPPRLITPLVAPRRFSRSITLSAIYPFAMPPKSTVARGSVMRACVPSTCTLRQSTCASASAMAASSGTTSRLKSHRRHTPPMVMSNSPPVRSQYPSAARKTSASSSPTSVHLPAAALSANSRLSGLKRLSSSSYRAQSASISRSTAASTSADTAHTVSNARNVTEPSSRTIYLLPRSLLANPQSPAAHSWMPAKQTLQLCGLRGLRK